MGASMESILRQLKYHAVAGQGGKVQENLRGFSLKRLRGTNPVDCLYQPSGR